MIKAGSKNVAFIADGILESTRVLFFVIKLPLCADGGRFQRTSCEDD